MKTQNKLQFPAILLASFLMLLVTNCEVDKEENKPVVATNEVTAIKSTEALCGGTITSDGGLGITSRGVCWSTDPTPTIGDSKTEEGAGAGSFISQMTDLQPNTNYYVRAYAKNSAGTGYGNAMAFSTHKVVTDVDGNVYSTVVIGHQEWFAENLKTTKYNNGTPIPNVTGYHEWNNLNTDAYVWYDNNEAAYKNEYGALYNWYAVRTGRLCPEGWHVPTDSEWTELTDYLGGESVAGGKLKETGTSHWESPNTGATNETGFTALPGGEYGGDGFIFFGYVSLWWSATERNYDDVWYRRITDDDSAVEGRYSSKESGFSVRCLKGNPSFIPTLSTSSVLSITQTTAVSGGNISSDGGTIILERGVCWSTDNYPTIYDNKTSDGTGAGEFTSTLTNLNPETIYNIRAYATNSTGTAYGKTASFKTASGNFTDSRDGNVYQYVNIGSQVWMAENLKYLPEVHSNAEFESQGNSLQPAYGVYGYDGTSISEAKATDNYQTYGVLYNWPAAMAGCPTGWHLPSDAEWTELTDYLGGVSVAGDKLKESGTSLWNNPITGATNETGFTALPGGYRYSDGTFPDTLGIGYSGLWWSASECNATSAWYRGMEYDYSYVFRFSDSNKEDGYSVRCIKGTAPSLTTSSVVSITQTTAESGGNISSDGGATVSERGVCWSTDNYPTIDDNKTSDGTGSGEFTSTITGLQPGTTYYVRAYATNSAGTAYGSQVSFTTTAVLTVSTVYSPATGKTWMDRNLGASRVATSSTDAEAYGDLYQWGRGTDGHEKRTSSTTSTLATSNIPGHGNFITNSSSPYDWRSTQNDSLWQGVNSTNNPCPSGYRLPTEAEWEAERTSWSSNDAAGAFASPLKLPVAGRRNDYGGTLGSVGSRGNYWSSTVTGTDARLLNFDSSVAVMFSSYRALGFSVRCLKDRNFD